MQFLSFMPTLTVTVALLGASFVAALGVSPSQAEALTIADKSVFYAPRRDTLFMLIDLWPQHQAIEALPAKDRDKDILDTAYAEAKMVLAKPGFGQIEKVRVEFGYINNTGRICSPRFQFHDSPRLYCAAQTGRRSDRFREQIGLYP